MKGCVANLRMLCPCESSHLEPFLYIHIFRSVSLDVLYNVWFRYLNLCFANSHMFVPLGVLTVRTSLDTCSNSQVYICYNSHTFVPLRVLTLRTFLYTCISSQEYMYHIIDTLVYETQLCNSHLSVPLRELTLRIFLFAYIFSKVNIYHVIDTFVYEPMLCELTYVRALSNAHTLNLFVYMKIFANIHISYDRYFVYELKFCEFTYVSAVASPHFEALCIQAHTYKNTYIIA